MSLRGAKVFESHPVILTKWGLGAGVELLLHLVQHGLHLLDLLVLLVEQHHRLRVFVLALRRGNALPGYCNLIRGITKEKASLSNLFEDILFRSMLVSPTAIPCRDLKSFKTSRH